MSMLYLCRRIQNSTAKSGGASAKNKLSALDLHRLCQCHFKMVLKSRQENLHLHPLGVFTCTNPGIARAPSRGSKTEAKLTNLLTTKNKETV